MKMGIRMATWVITRSALIGSMLFLPAWTFDYWQAWVFLAVFISSGTVSVVFLAIHDPAALQRRMHRGPAAETRPVQKIVMTVLSFFLVAMLVLSALDHRLGWSSVPTAMSLAGNAMVVTGLGISMLVIVQNSYAAATITVEPGQTLVSTGLYGIVRHPMYTASLIMMAGIPLALGSYWGLVIVVPSLILLIVRILDEEQLLTQELTGYRGYAQRVRCRLLPYVW